MPFLRQRILCGLRLSYKTAANYSMQIKAKLGVNTTAEMARLAFQQGIFKA